MRVEPTQLRTSTVRASRRTTPLLSRGDAETRRRNLRRLLATALLLAIPPMLFAQAGKDMGPAGQFYKKPQTKFKVTPGVKKQGGDVKYRANTSTGVSSEYAILDGDVVLEYQDITIHADKLTYNFKTQDAVGEGHIILDQGPTRLTGDHMVFNLDSKTGTFFNATGALQPDMFFIGEKLE